ncbi:methyl-accepting chemotaxis protein [Duganella sp.]|uniref:methyl-accepting chemotaxis protein n=1 Tax=Duganella sp. TaxID=1904440 RepID=UPI0031D8BAEA
MNIRDWKIGHRLGAAFALLLVLMVGCISLSIQSLGLLNERTAKIVEDKYPKTVLAYEVLDLVNRNTRALRNVLLLDNPDEADRERQLLLDNRKELAGDFDKLAALVKSGTGVALLDAMRNADAAYRNSQQTLLELAAAGRKQEATVLLFTSIRRDQASYADAVRALIQHQNDSLAESGAQAAQLYHSTRKVLIVLAALALVLGAALAVWITRSITAPLRQAVDIARAVANGDLGGVIRDGAKDETGLLLLAMRDMKEGLVRIVATVRSGAETVAAASTEIAAGNQDLSSRTEAQAGSLEETASSMEQLTAAVQHNADYASQVNQLAISATEVAAQGGLVVSRMAFNMDAISAAAQNIAEITQVIDGIAFQTNILALNAAVEAAHAGEQGRGFAVVATEVRSLAQRSAAAAREIRVLIGDSVAKVAEGSMLADQAGATMQQVVASIKGVTDMMAEISAASQEQSEGIVQINRAIAQMDSAIRQNAALVEEAAAASQSLQDQAGNLTRCVSVFKLHASRGAQADAAVQRIGATMLA